MSSSADMRASQSRKPAMRRVKRPQRARQAPLAVAAVGDALWRYELRVVGHLDSKWSNWFDGLSVTLDNDGSTVLSGPVIDQAALHGLLTKIRDLGMPLLLVKRVYPGQAHRANDRSPSP